MPDTVTNGNEVLLFGTRYPLWGMTKRTSITPFPPQIVTGAYTRSDKVVESEWVLSDFSGGNGIEFSRGDQDQDRYWYGDLEARYRFLSLAPEIVTAGSTAGPADVIIEYNERLYLTVGPNVYRWNDTDAVFDLVHTISGTATDIAVFDGDLYILTTSSFHAYKASDNDWVDYGTDDFTPSGYALCVWDDKLWRLGTDNVIAWSISPDDTETNWNSGGKLRLPPGYCKQLIVYWDNTGQPALFAPTKIGLWGYEADSEKFYETPLTHPVLDNACKGAAVWRGELYLPAGTSIYKYNGTTIQAIGPDKDDGLPLSYHGTINQVIAGHAFWFCTLASPVTGSDDDDSASTDIVEGYDVGWQINDTWFNASFTNGAILVSPQVAWHILSSRVTSGTIGAAVAASTDNHHRIWFSDGDGIYYSELPLGLHNPLQNPTTRYRDSGELISSWFDMNWGEVDKLALSLDIETRDTSPDESMMFYVGWDESDDWQLVGEVTQPGHVSFRIGDRTGLPFKSARIRIVMKRGDNVLKAPKLRSCVLTYVLTPKKLWGWELNLNCTQDYEGTTAKELVESLLDANDANLAGELVYLDDDTRQQTARVLIRQLVGSEATGIGKLGRYTVSVLELDN